MSTRKNICKDPWQCCSGCATVCAICLLLLELVQSIECTHLEFPPYGKGCRVAGNVEVNRVKGNLHIAAGRSQSQGHGSHGHHVHQLNAWDIANFNVSHHVTHFSIGPSFPRRVAPLNRIKFNEPGTAKHKNAVLTRTLAAKQVNYMLQLVPVLYEYSGGSIIEGYQYSTQTSYKRITQGSNVVPLPGKHGIEFKSTSHVVQVYFSSGIFRPLSSNTKKVDVLWRTFSHAYAPSSAEPSLCSGLLIAGC
jgi:hypothetical protein